MRFIIGYRSRRTDQNAQNFERYGQNHFGRNRYIPVARAHDNTAFDLGLIDCKTQILKDGRRDRAEDDGSDDLG